MTLAAQQIRAAQLHLRKHDPVMKWVIKQVGPCTLKPQRQRLDMLVRSIVSQQISTSAAKTILARLKDAAGKPQFTAQRLLELSLDDYKSLGVSRQKATYLIDLATQVENKNVRLDQLSRWEDEKVIEHLIQVKGIGRWTAQMFLIFSLGRTDVVPHDDLGLKTAQMNLYGLEELPNRDQFHQIARPWRPYASIASWYLWRALEQKLSHHQLPD